jgi:hypothetical protein
MSLEFLLSPIISHISEFASVLLSSGFLVLFTLLVNFLRRQSPPIILKLEATPLLVF